MTNQFLPNGGFLLPEKPYNYVSQWPKDITIDKESFDFYQSVEVIQKHDKRKRHELNRFFSNQELVLLANPMVTYAGNQQSIRMSKEVNSLKTTKKVFINGELPREIKRQNYEKIIEKINQKFALNWQNIEELNGKDIDLNLSFEIDPESSDLEMIYTIYVMDFDKSKIEIVWSELRKLFNEIINTLKRSQPRYRKKVEDLERLAVIHIEW